MQDRSVANVAFVSDYSGGVPSLNFTGFPLQTFWSRCAPIF